MSVTFSVTYKLGEKLHKFIRINGVNTYKSLRTVINDLIFLALTAILYY